MCRKTIQYDITALRSAPSPTSAQQEFRYRPDPTMRELQAKMAALFRAQKAKGGIIDPEEEKKKLLLSHVSCIIKMFWAFVCLLFVQIHEQSCFWIISLHQRGARCPGWNFSIMKAILVNRARSMKHLQLFLWRQPECSIFLHSNNWLYGSCHHSL